MTEDVGVALEDLGDRGSGDGKATIKFAKLVIDGFKSFANRVEVIIEPGVTGVVGPNGCGKSNLLEALRWALGETSARRMRGDGMDDVIFAGSEKRNSRSVAEVGLVLDNSGRTAAAAFNDADVLEVTRRIDRGQGSTYRVNGKIARQRDVQILFQDHAAGATSPAIVSQGRVNALIQMRPPERRIVLEEAAGVSGLGSRKHDAKLKINQTEQNLQRAEDSIIQTGDVVSALKRQAAQARRRREIDGRVREALAGLLQLRRFDVTITEQQARERHTQSDARVAEAIMVVKKREAAREVAAAALGPARDARTAAEAGYARAVAKLEGIEVEAIRRAQDILDAQRRVVEIAGDRKRGDDAVAEAERIVERLRQERETLAEEEAIGPEAIEQAVARMEAAGEQVMLAEDEVSVLATELASRQATRVAAQRRRDETSRRLDGVEARLVDAERRLTKARLEAAPDNALVEAAEAVAIAETIATEAEELLINCETSLVEARVAEEAALSKLRDSISQQSRLSAELSGLEAVRDRGAAHSPVSSRLIASEGLEGAVAAALGDGAEAGNDSSEDAWWADLNGDSPIAGLAKEVSGASEVNIALSKAILCHDLDAMFAQADAGLTPGDILVHPSGAFARWDGFRGRGRASGVSEALKRGARMRLLREELAALREEIVVQQRVADAAVAGLATCRRADEETRRASRNAYDALRREREALTAKQRAGEESSRKLALLENEVGLIRAERTEANTSLLEASQALGEIPAEGEQSRQLEEVRRKLDSFRRESNTARADYERQRSAADMRSQRFRATIAQEADWGRRHIEARERRADLTRRAEDAEKALSEVSNWSATPAEVVEVARLEVADAKEDLIKIAGILDITERAREAAEMDLRTAEVVLGAGREERAVHLAAIEQAVAAVNALADQIRQRMNLEPHDLDAIVPPPVSAPSDMTTALTASEQRLVRFERERDSVGPVNFLAEQELEEQEKKLGEMEKAKAELKETVGKLRKVIEELDAEARIKLQEAFRRIDSHFGELFLRLFGGGEAHLKLVGSEDILEAGLEIFASPPGKRLQILSLLSGGEQALTAMALVFAAFLANPAPICVLDEVDAPLDDANTDMLCRLIEQMSVGDATRFLVVTHKPLTMARMHRLYGVTMMERGVSNVSKVDLDKAFEFADA